MELSDKGFYDKTDLFMFYYIWKRFFCDFSKISGFFVEFFENLFDNKQNLIDKGSVVIFITNFLMK